MVKFVGVLFIVGVLIIFGPFLTLWALNTLFPVLNIPYTFETWAASAFLSTFFGPFNISKRD